MAFLSLAAGQAPASQANVFSTLFFPLALRRLAVEIQLAICIGAEI